MSWIDPYSDSWDPCAFGDGTTRDRDENHHGGS
jgi:hypothetical protein